MEKTDCEHCVCLVQNDEGQWICNELDRPIDEIDECPEED